MKTAAAKNYELCDRLAHRGMNVTPSQAATLRRAELTLQRWFEGECGDSNQYNSWAIERDEVTGKPYRVTYPHRGDSYRVRIADKEQFATERVKKVCEKAGLYYFIQTDPRGCALYVSSEPINSNNYTNGVACCS